MKRRVVVTGVGLVTCLGPTAEETWRRLIAGESGIKAPTPQLQKAVAEGRLSLFEESAHHPALPHGGQFPTIHGIGDVVLPEALFQGSLPIGPRRKPAKYLDGHRPGRLLAVAAHEALAASGFLSAVPADPEPATRFLDRVGLSIGCEPAMINRDDREWVLKASPSLAPSVVAIFYGALGPFRIISTACAAGNQAVGEGFHDIRHGLADAMIVGGTDSPLHVRILTGYSYLHAICVREDEPQKLSRPFDKGHAGFVIAEGAGGLTLEELELAKSHNAPIVAEVLGSATGHDARKIADPDPAGRGYARCLAAALVNAGIKPEDVDVVFVHGTSTEKNDAAEAAAIRLVFGEHAKQLIVVPTKGSLGHAMLAAGAIQNALAALSLQNQELPPALNLESPANGCDLNFVTKKSQKRDFRIVVSVSAGFNGELAVLVLKRFDGE